MVEAVLVVPALMLVLLVAVQCALWAHAAQVAQLAASEGDRVARADGGSTAAATATAQGLVGARSSSVVGGTVAVTGLPGGQVQVAVDGRAVPVLPWLTLPVHAVAAGPVQMFRVSA